ncbi:MAG: hypothetical protein EBU84_14690 [Actinobacteria bacterium]|nr:hypothetical protein [Actinomycetota bacterium]
MKPGDMVTLRSGVVSVCLMSELLEKTMEEHSELSLTMKDIGDIRSFKRGDTATVIEVNPGNTARVKLFYSSGLWWGNVSDLVILK